MLGPDIFFIFAVAEEERLSLRPIINQQNCKRNCNFDRDESVRFSLLSCEAGGWGNDWELPIGKPHPNKSAANPVPACYSSPANLVFDKKIISLVIIIPADPCHLSSLENLPPWKYF